MLLKEMSMARGVTGCEDEVRNLIRNQIRSYVDEINYDALGSVIAYKKVMKHCRGL